MENQVVEEEQAPVVAPVIPPPANTNFVTVATTARLGQGYHSLMRVRTMPCYEISDRWHENARIRPINVRWGAPRKIENLSQTQVDGLRDTTGSNSGTKLIPIFQAAFPAMGPIVARQLGNLALTQPAVRYDMSGFFTLGYLVYMIIGDYAARGYNQWPMQNRGVVRVEYIQFNDDCVNAVTEAVNTGKLMMDSREVSDADWNAFITICAGPNGIGRPPGFDVTHVGTIYDMAWNGVRIYGANDRDAPQARRATAQEVMGAMNLVCETYNMRGDMVAGFNRASTLITGRTYPIDSNPYAQVEDEDIEHFVIPREEPEYHDQDAYFDNRYEATCARVLAERLEPIERNVARLVANIDARAGGDAAPAAPVPNVEAVGQDPEAVEVRYNLRNRPIVGMDRILGARPRLPPPENPRPFQGLYNNRGDRPRAASNAFSAALFYSTNDTRRNVMDANMCLMSGVRDQRVRRLFQQHFIGPGLYREPVPNPPPHIAHQNVFCNATMELNTVVINEPRFTSWFFDKFLHFEPRTQYANLESEWEVLRANDDHARITALSTLFGMMVSIGISTSFLRMNLGGLQLYRCAANEQANTTAKFYFDI